ncbi:PAS domain-containing protein [Streptomyces griseoviridis]|uniref:Helix-turn-helix transcriptional regulator n=2 Tax=Streptomyces TaxID=1883 RepID=A0A3Q9KSW4_STRGD|nr:MULTISPECIES: PAS domain-containing protein [Streptomyces]AZS88707.1 helix-turn-helix transcriptional regulator [Streptomyces griseoviridis]MDH6697335.1 DNA-binding CsgD family transcriptional regulator [Streptomyces sp. MAA16]MDT0475944.1 PAS domain-containing protein [Streptomyces sp. DSM 41014]QCN84454.1 helix-turn-helix transcriptional regulator [Streptomyces griseoviridis]
MTPTPHTTLMDRAQTPAPAGSPEQVAGLTEDFDRPDAYVACLDPALTIQQVNREFDSRFGGPAADLCGKHFCDLVHPSVQQPLLRQFARMLEGKRHRFATEVIAVGQESAASMLPLSAMAVRGAHTPDVAAILVVMSAAGEKAEAAAAVAPRKRLLSEIDARILEGIAAGVSTIPLASRLYLSRQGVEYHVTGLLRALKVPNRAALVSRAYSMGVLKVGTWPPRVVEDFIK